MPPVADLQFPGLENKGQSFISPSQRVGITFYPLESRNNPFMAERGTQARQVDWDPNRSEAGILRFTWNKTMGQAAGQWTALLKEKVTTDTGEPLMVLDEIQDGDWVDIAIHRNGIRIPLCRGVVDSRRRQRTSIGGTTSTVYAIAGRDHGAFFEYPITYANIWAQKIAQAAFGLFTKKIDGKVGGRPDEMFEAIIMAALGRGFDSGQWEMPESLKTVDGRGKTGVHDLLEIVAFNATRFAEGLRGHYFNEISLWSAGAQTLHQTLSQWVNPILNEWFYDLLLPGAFVPKNELGAYIRPTLKRPIRGEEAWAAPAEEIVYVEGEPRTAAGKPFSFEALYGTPSFVSDSEFGTIAAIIRERPFINSEEGLDSIWFDLPTWRIPTWLLSNDDFGVSTDQRFNLFELIADFGLGPQSEQTVSAKPVFFLEDVRDHGLRTFQQSCRYYGDGGMGKWWDARKVWQKLLVDWYAPNPHLLQGSTTAKVLLPEIHIGQRVILDPNDPQQEEQYYCEGVALDYTGPTETSGAAGATTLTLTRGFKGTDEEFVKAVSGLSGLYEEVHANEESSV